MKRLFYYIALFVSLAATKGKPLLLIAGGACIASSVDAQQMNTRYCSAANFNQYIIVPASACPGGVEGWRNYGVDSMLWRFKKNWILGDTTIVTGYLTAPSITNKLPIADFYWNNLTGHPDSISYFINDAGYITSASIASKVNYTDTASMLSTVWSNTANRVRYVDTTAMLSPLWNNIASKENALGFTPYNATNPAGYITSSAIGGKVNYTDTAGMLSSVWANITANGSNFANYTPIARTISTTSPLSGGGDLSANRTLSIADAVADGSTKGAATFTAADFNAASGNISLDYTNGQAANGSVKGFLSAADWTTFNNKQAALSGTGFVKISGTTISYDNSTYLTVEVDGSVTNEIELPSQTGNNGKVLSTNGTTPSWITASSGTATSVGLSSSDLSVSGSPITTSGNITANLSTTGVSAGNYDWVTVDTKGRVTAAGNMATPIAIAAGARNFGTAYQISTTVQSSISVSSQLSCALSLTGGQSGTITMEISPNGSTGWIYIGQISGSNTGTLTVGLSTNQITGGSIRAELPIGYYWRLTTNNLVGTPTYTFNGGSYITY